MWQRSGFHLGGGVIALLVVLWLGVSIVGLVAIYIGDEVVQPSVNEHSVPPPLTY